MSETTDFQTIDWRAFLIEHPPGARRRVDRAALMKNEIEVNLPDLELFCGTECENDSHCKGSLASSGKLFGNRRRKHMSSPESAIPWDVIMIYRCEKCDGAVKSYSLRFWHVERDEPQVHNPCDVEKIAEWPQFSPRTPGKVTKLIGPDRDLFLKGRRSEIEGLGLGAFSYYRRVIENQKARLLDEVIRVGRHLQIDEEDISTLEAAREEQQFRKALENVKDAIPPALLINGHNPFTLLHSALSKGIHERTDEECLDAAHDIRLILLEFAERLAEAMDEKRELGAAISRLVTRNQDTSST